MSTQKYAYQPPGESLQSQSVYYVYFLWEDVVKLKWLKVSTLNVISTNI